MLYLLFTILGRNRLPALIRLYRKNDLKIHHITLGHGTATSEVLNAFGLERGEKVVCMTVLSAPLWKPLKRELIKTMRLDIPGMGIAFTIPMSSIGGPRELAYLTQEQSFERGEESTLQFTEQELLVVIGNQGYNGMIMNAAREAGAGGGTVLHAQGTGTETAEQFLGISLASEKDVVLIVAKKSQKNAIMRSIMEKAGLNTKAKAIVFSLPVTDTAGIRLSDESKEEEAPSAPVSEETK
ncbi:MAG: P-II family nitrogen regulator [Clostridia bacterium]|nr:P-II family nitrogen regulator [Clostridia bacterium]